MIDDDDDDHDDDDDDVDNNDRIKPSWLRRWRALRCVVSVIYDASQIPEENERRTKLREGKERLLSWTSFLR